MAVIKMYCSRSYRWESYDTVGGTAQRVSAGIYGNTGTFTAPPLTETVFNAAIDDYITKRGLYTQGGVNYRDAFDASYAVLIGHLDTQADFVDGVANGNGTIIAMGGFVATKGETTKAERPGQVSGLMVLSNAAGTVNMTCGKMDGASGYICIVTDGAPLPDGVKVTDTGKVIFNETAMQSIRSMIIDGRTPRRKSFNGLEPGNRYYFAYVAINSAGVGPLSNPLAVVVAL